MAAANAYLGSPFQLRGDGRPRRQARARRSATRPPTSSPTRRSSTRRNGIYACRAAVELDGAWRWWPAATSIGVRPTFVTGRGVLVEAFLLDYEGDLYDRELRLVFLERLRGELRFDSVDALVAQMAATSTRPAGSRPDAATLRRRP